MMQSTRYMMRSSAMGGNKTTITTDSIPSIFDQFFTHENKRIYKRYKRHTINKEKMEQEIAFIPIGNVRKYKCITNPKLAKAWAKGEL